MIKQFQSPQKLLRAAGNERTNMGRTHKAKPVDQTDDLSVALGKLYGGNCGCAFETGKTGRFHPATLPEKGRAKETAAFVFYGKYVWLPFGH